MFLIRNLFGRLKSNIHSKSIKLDFSFRVYSIVPLGGNLMNILLSVLDGHRHPHIGHLFQFPEVGIVQAHTAFRSIRADGSRIMGTVDPDAIPVPLAQVFRIQLRNQGP